MRIPEGLFSANVACQVAHVTHRMLDYWVRTAVVEPTRVFECDYDDRGDKRRKAYNLFDFAALVQIKIVKDLRDSGVGLQRIRFAIGRLRATWGKSWQSVWLVTDGRTVFEATDDPRTVQSLAKKDKGQLCFSIVALGAVTEQVFAGLKRCSPFPVTRYKGVLKRWSARIVSA